MSTAKGSSKSKLNFPQKLAEIPSKTGAGKKSTAKGSSKSKLNFPLKSEIPSKTQAGKKSTVKGSSKSMLQLVSKSVEISSEIAAQVQKADKDERMTCDVPRKKRKVHPPRKYDM